MSKKILQSTGIAEIDDEDAFGNLSPIPKCPPAWEVAKEDVDDSLMSSDGDITGITSLQMDPLDFWTGPVDYVVAMMLSVKRFFTRVAHIIFMRE